MPENIHMSPTAQPGPSLRVMSKEMKEAPVVHGVPGSAQDVEDYVRILSRRSGQTCDWGYSGGHAIIHTTGDVEAVKAVVSRVRKIERLLWDGGFE